MGHTLIMSESRSSFPPRRPSKSGDAADDAARARIRRMPIEERMLEALRLHAALAKLERELRPTGDR
jgi:hypothetical protein